MMCMILTWAANRSQVSSGKLVVELCAQRDATAYVTIKKENNNNFVSSKFQFFSY